MIENTDKSKYAKSNAKSNTKYAKKEAVVTSAFFIIVLFVVIGAEALMNMTPPTCRDSLVHHLAIPKLWLTHGFMYSMSWAEFSYYPMNIQILYWLCLLINNDILPKWIHMGFGLGISYLIFLYLKKETNKLLGLIGAVIFASTPIVIWLSSSAYIDLGMTFFTTLSILAFVKWFDLKFCDLKTLLFSGVSMGLAVGSKYNALIVFCFLTCAVVIVYVRNTQKQMKALLYGFIFCLTVLFVLSPWCIKNHIKTGNPFYPLFDKAINNFQNESFSMAVKSQLKAKPGNYNLFMTRYIFYGESFLETALIPIRIFFQGEDYSYQYFQGRLNPILILFLPFVFVGDRHRHVWIFVLFYLFYMSIAFFTTMKQVRYLMPILPILSILAVFGIKNCFEMLYKYKLFSHVTRYTICSFIGVLILLNLLYLHERFVFIDPMTYILHEVNREEYLSEHLGEYRTVRYINENLPKDATVFTMFLGRRAYYLDRSYRHESRFGMDSIDILAKMSDQERKSYFSDTLHVSHILMRSELFLDYLHNNFSKEVVEQFLNYISTDWKFLFEANGYSVWQIE